MRQLYVFQTRIGPFYIGKDDNGRFHPIHDDEDLGSYVSSGQAADDLAGGHTTSISCDIETDTLGIPEDIAEWERLPGA